MHRLLVLVSVACLPGQVHADQCAPREVVWLSGPKSGARVPPSIRFRLYIGTGCSSIPEGPPSQFRLLDSRGREVPTRRQRWGGYTELVPTFSLAHGAYRLERRHAVDAKRLGSWKAMTRVTVVGKADRKPPQLTGRVEASTRPVWGTNFLSPCEAEEGWELETKLRMQPAVDNSARHEDLLYTLVRRERGKRKLHLVRSFWPRPAGTLVTYSFKEEYDWGKTWEYYLQVRDPSGNWSTHPRGAIVVTTPKRPPRPKGAPPSKLQ